MTELEMFKRNWKPNYNDSSYECFCFRTDLNKLVEEIRAHERTNVLDEVIKIAIFEIDFESREEQHRFIEFMKQLKTQ